MKKEQIEELRNEIATLTEKLNRLENQDERPMDYEIFYNEKLEKGGLRKNILKKVLTLGYLMEIRDEWNRIDESEINNRSNAVIYKDNMGEIGFDYAENFFYPPLLFHFKDAETAKLFLDTFRPQLELIKELL